MREYSSAAKTNLLATSADEPFLVLLEITHPDLTEPVRVVQDSQDLTFEGNTYIACPFDVVLPDDVAGQLPQAKLQIDNIGRELTQWLESSNGGQEARCRIIQIMRSDLATVEFEITLDLTALVVNNEKVTGNLGFVNMLGRTGTVPSFTPQSAPGLW